MFGQTEGLSCLFLFLYLTIHLGSVSINGKTVPFLQGSIMNAGLFCSKDSCDSCR